MTITTTAPHGLLIDALSRLTVLVREHSDELPDLYVCLASDRAQVVVQITEHGATEADRRVGVDRLARLLKLARPVEVCEFYQTCNDLWHVYTRTERLGGTDTA